MAIVDVKSFKISATLLGTFLKCGRQAMGRARDKKYPEQTVNSFRGLLAHRLIARAIDGEGVDDFWKATREEVGRALNREMNRSGVSYRMLRAIADEVQPWVERTARLDHSGLIGTEIYAQWDAPDDAVSWTGRIDAVYAVDGGVKIRDWKTGSVSFSEPQLRFYGLLWSVTHQEAPVAIEAVSVATGEILAVDAARIDEAMRDVVELEEFMEDWWDAPIDEVPASPGPWCSWCPLREGCEEAA